ncbi:hypothetical protein BUALT_Bualt08G0092300 [Buddleja alternifolia]|uniref:Ornithine decarboxylase n=1 Tax=Buddleja alternifolia TaxID=168488 RepID=A0AAV6X4Z2_9LAMI|nr:hypothetical protein BUALT_Bualt08G0092300 [Buddleja alternifolia]
MLTKVPLKRLEKCSMRCLILPYLKCVCLTLGGFTDVEQFKAATDTIKSSLVEYFDDEPGLIVIAEPGRFFGESVFALVTHIFSKRTRGEVQEHWINDGVFGSVWVVYYGMIRIR